MCHTFCARQKEKKATQAAKKLASDTEAKLRKLRLMMPTGSGNSKGGAAAAAAAMVREQEEEEERRRQEGTSHPCVGTSLP